MTAVILFALAALAADREFSRPWPTRIERMRFCDATRCVMRAWRWAINARHSRTRLAGTTTVGS